MNWISKFVYIMLIVVSVIVGTWNFLVACASAYVTDGFIGFMGSMESLFTVYVAIFLIGYSWRILKKERSEVTKSE